MAEYGGITASIYGIEYSGKKKLEAADMSHRYFKQKKKKSSTE